MSRSIILASASPRRTQLLQSICPDFTVHPADIDEQPIASEPPSELVSRLAKEKANHVLSIYSDAIVIGADTLIACEKHILGKPKDLEDFLAMMSMLSGRSHTVHTAVACLSSQQQAFELVSSQVSFASISEAEALSYWQTGEPKDKAGGYAIQGLGEQFVMNLNGSYSAVVGLPLYHTKQMLQRFC